MVTRVWEEAKEIGSREVVSGKWLVRAIGVTSFIILTTLGAYVWIPLPFTPVPITLQTLFVLLSGAVLGRNLGPLSQLGYWLVGGLGLPLFAGGTFGFNALFGPTGGYLIGFVVASWMVGWLMSKENISFVPLKRDATLFGGLPPEVRRTPYESSDSIGADSDVSLRRNPATTFIVGSSIILFFGAGWLAIVLHCSMKKAIFLGVLPFIPGDILKIILATLIYKKIQPRTKYLFS